MTPPERGKAAADLVKVTIPLPEGTWHRHASEGLWAESLGTNRFRLRNIPFFAYELSLDDVVQVGHSGVDVIERAGHSTYRVFLRDGLPPSDLDEWLGRLELAGANYERATARLIALDVPPAADVFGVYDVLKQGTDRHVWDFEEGHVGHPV